VAAPAFSVKGEDPSIRPRLPVRCRQISSREQPVNSLLEVGLSRSNDQVDTGGSMRHEDMAHSVAAVAELQDQLSEISSTTSLFTTIATASDEPPNRLISIGVDVEASTPVVVGRRYGGAVDVEHAAELYAQSWTLRQIGGGRSLTCGGPSTSPCPSHHASRRSRAHRVCTQQILELRDQGLTWNEVAKQVG
jgi:hypothetical protein